MRLFLSISEGESAASAKVVFASTDKQLIQVVGRAILRRLGVEAPARLGDLESARRRRGVEETEES